MKHPRTIVKEVLSSNMERDIWTGHYDKVLPISAQSFELSAVLPAVFYMFRYGKRRGKGKFLDTFGGGGRSAKEMKKAATVKEIAETLAQSSKFFGFDNEVRKAILADLLLCFCLENSKHDLGREKQIQRVAPTHYMASWIDLPESVAHLRFVPEMIVAMLANQQGGHVEPNGEGDRTRFAVGRNYEENILLRAFSQGVIRSGELASLTSDRFDEQDESVGLDQLLMIRLAQQLGEAPDRQRGNQGEISNQRPIAQRAAEEFSEDIRRFVSSYADVIPRRTFVELLESCISVGMTTILTSTVSILFDWAETGKIGIRADQKPEPLFVDCSNGVNLRLRSLAEQSMDDFIRRIQRFSVILMALRLLDHNARYDPKIRKLDISFSPDASEWLNVLGDLLYEQRPEAALIFQGMEQKAEELAEKLEEEEYAEAARILRGDQSEPNVIWRLAEALTLLQQRSSTQSNLMTMVDSMFLSGRSNGLSSKRFAIRTDAATGSRKRRELRSLVFTDSVLDYLAHRHLLRSGGRREARKLSFKEFIHAIRNRYGFCIDAAPPGLPVPNNLLRANRTILERRLRDLGLLIGVNDAEAMKRLGPRFNPSMEDSQ